MRLFVFAQIELAHSINWRKSKQTKRPNYGKNEMKWDEIERNQSKSVRA